MSSVALNLAEGNDRYSPKDKLRFFNYALTSMKEVKQVFALEEVHHLMQEADEITAMLFALNRKLTATASRHRQR